MRVRLVTTSIVIALTAGWLLRASDPGEVYLILPEPRSMGSSISRPLGGSQHTVFSPAHRDADGKLQKYSPAEFAKLGISRESFMERAASAADQRLATVKPEMKKDESGKVLYAVYRGADETIACLLVAPSLAEVFKNTFPDGVWLAAPDRHSLFVFPARAEAIADFAEDLRGRFDGTAYAASDEVFVVKPGVPLRAAASFARN